MKDLSKRGNLVLGVVIGLIIAGIWYISGHLWYVPEEGYCLGTLAQCFH